MRAKNTVWMLAMACAVGAVVWLLDQRATDPVAVPNEGERLVGGIAFEDVELLVIERGEMRLELTRDEARWQLSQPLAGRADSARVSELLQALEGAVSAETISRAQQDRRELTHVDFGLAPPETRLVVATAARRIELQLGRDTAVGDELYASAGGDDVYVVNRELRRALPQAIDDLRDRRLLAGSPSEVGVIEIRRRGVPFVRLQQEGRHWSITQPVVVRASPEAVDNLLQVLFSVGISRFIVAAAGSDEMRSGRAVWGGAYGLGEEEAALEIRVRRNPRDPGQTVRFGATPPGEPGLIYALRPEEQMVATVPAGALAALAVDLADLRARELFDTQPEEVTDLLMVGGDRKIGFSRDVGSAWALMQPVVDRADHSLVSSLVTRLMGMRAESFVEPDSTNMVFDAGALTSTCTVTFVASSTTTTVTIVRSKDTQLAAVLLEGDATLYRVDMTALPELVAGLPDALVFRDKVILSLPRDEIGRIEVAHEGTEETVIAERKPDGAAWHTPAPSPAEVDPVVLEELLFLFSNLKALRVESLAMRDPTAYGMDTPYLQVTLGLRAGEGLQKVLMVGRPVGEGARYAMIRGWDTLFVVGPEVLKILALPLVRTPDPAAPPSADTVGGAENSASVPPSTTAAPALVPPRP